MKELISRRSMLSKTVSIVGSFATWSIIGPLIFSCDSRQKKNQAESEELKLQSQKPCPSDQNLSPDQQAIRKNLKYVDQTPVSTKTCDNCKLYTNAAPGVFCGGCKIVPGFIHPKGYCSSWYARM